MKKLTLAVILAGMAGAASAAEINYAYAMYGSQEIAPLQVFDDGSQIYMQMPAGRIAAPPIPFTENGEPIQYEIAGHYVKIPIHDRVILRVGSARAFLQSARDAEAGQVRSANGVRGKNVWYGAAPPARITRAAPIPEPAVKVSPVPMKQGVVEELKLEPKVDETQSKSNDAKKVDTKVTPEPKIELAVKPKEDRDQKAEVAERPSSKPTVQDAEKPAPLTGRFDVSMPGLFTGDDASNESGEVIVPVEGAMTSEHIARLSNLTVVTIESDGSTAGYRKAKAAQSLIRKTAKVSIKPVGAPAGHIRIVPGV